MTRVFLIALVSVLSAHTAAADRGLRRLQDGESLPRYLDRDEIVTELAARNGAVASCLTGAPADRSLRFELAIAPDGAVRDVRLDGDVADGAERRCISDALATPAFAPHDDEPLVVTGSVAVAEGVALPIFAVTLQQRPVDVLFLYLPPDLDAERRSTISAELGHVEDARPAGAGGN